MEFVTANDRQECKPPKHRILQLLVGSSFKWDVYREKLCKYLWDPGIRSAARAGTDLNPRISSTSDSHSSCLLNPLVRFLKNQRIQSNHGKIEWNYHVFLQALDFEESPANQTDPHVCVYTCVYIYIRLYMHICYIYWSAVIDMSMNTCIYIRVHILYVYMHIPVDTCMNM